MLTIFQFFATKTDASKLRMLSGSPKERLLQPILDYIEARGGRLHIRWGCRSALPSFLSCFLVPHSGPWSCAGVRRAAAFTRIVQRLPLPAVLFLLFVASDWHLTEPRQPDVFIP